MPTDCNDKKHKQNSMGLTIRWWSIFLSSKQKELWLKIDKARYLDYAVVVAHPDQKHHYKIDRKRKNWTDGGRAIQKKRLFWAHGVENICQPFLIQLSVHKSLDTHEMKLYHSDAKTHYLQTREVDVNKSTVTGIRFAKIISAAVYFIS